MLRGMTQAELAKKAGVRQASISDLVNGKSKTVLSDTLFQIAKALSVSADYLVNPELELLPEPRDERKEAIALIVEAAETVGWEELAERLQVSRLFGNPGPHRDVPTSAYFADDDIISKYSAENKKKRTPELIRKKVYVAEYTMLDYWYALTDPEELDGFFKAGLLPCSLRGAEKAFKQSDWERDGVISAIWIPPFCMLNSGGDTVGFFIWHVKQSNNGISWLCADSPVKFVGVNPPSKWIEVEITDYY